MYEVASPPRSFRPRHPCPQHGPRLQPPLDLTPPPRACPRLPCPAASPYYPADRSPHKYSECAFAIPLFSIMSLNTSALAFLHPTQSTRHYPPTHQSSQRHVASGQQVPSSSASGPVIRPVKCLHRRSTSTSTSTHEHGPEHDHGHDEHEPSNTTEEQEDPLP